MSAEMQVQIRRNAEEMREAIADLHKWEEKIEKKDKELKETPVVAKVRQRVFGYRWRREGDGACACSVSG